MYTLTTSPLVLTLLWIFIELACTVVRHSELTGGITLGIWRCWQRRAWRRETVGLYRIVICCDVWQDSRPVVLIATNSNTTKTETVKQNKRDCTFTYYKCPSSLSLYNCYMGGVNHNDQLHGYYNVHLKCRKYYKTSSGFVESRHYLLSYVLYQS